MDIKDNLAQNLIRYRKSAGLTQAELAEKLNYTDKAVSKWERGESVPDLYVLKQLADFYGVKIDTLISEPKKDRPQLLRNISKKRGIICLCCAGLVWLIAILCFALLGIIVPTITHSWLAFIYALPITCIILLVLTAVWHKRLTNTIIISVLIWTIILAIYLSFFYLFPSPPFNLWMIFLIGIPAQALTIFWFMYRKVK
ncbi:MAG: helix-turn-helix domain-containing protein [Clostridia bacterium]|nr:helix-turn-helix domain-containing protein [Clostridia bacterium]